MTKILLGNVKGPKGADRKASRECKDRKARPGPPERPAPPGRRVQREPLGHED